jgi:anti-anti-sigma factor
MEFARPEDGIVWFLHIVKRDLGPVLALALEGRVFTSTVNEFGRVLRSEDLTGRRGLILDFSRVDYVNGEGLRLLEETAVRGRALGVDVVVCGLTPIVRTTFDLSGASANLVIVPSRDEALHRFGSGS